MEEKFKKIKALSNFLYKYVIENLYDHRKQKNGAGTFYNLKIDGYTNPFSFKSDVVRVYIENGNKDVWLVELFGEVKYVHYANKFEISTGCCDILSLINLIYEGKKFYLHNKRNKKNKRIKLKF